VCLVLVPYPVSSDMMEDSGMLEAVLQVMQGAFAQSLLHWKSNQYYLF
jgi:hypothetical protein